ncbi:hypothetical protein [Stackebrandtia soli]|uniref:hypothetical protein n=1 Tax=Stackebrandtia soli TaxID=1892856 RepID=UPI0039ED6FAB
MTAFALAPHVDADSHEWVPDDDPHRRRLARERVRDAAIRQRRRPKAEPTDSEWDRLGWRERVLNAHRDRVEAALAERRERDRTPPLVLRPSGTDASSSSEDLPSRANEHWRNLARRILARAAVDAPEFDWWAPPDNTPTPRPEPEPGPAHPFEFRRPLSIPPNEEKSRSERPIPPHRQQQPNPSDSRTAVESEHLPRWNLVRRVLLWLFGVGLSPRPFWWAKTCRDCRADWPCRPLVRSLHERYPTLSPADTRRRDVELERLSHKRSHSDSRVDHKHRRRPIRNLNTTLT